MCSSDLLNICSAIDISLQPLDYRISDLKLDYLIKSTVPLEKNILLKEFTLQKGDTLIIVVESKNGAKAKFSRKIKKRLKRLKKSGIDIKYKIKKFRTKIIIIAKAKSVRSEEHTSELQSRRNLVCRLLLEKKKKK